MERLNYLCPILCLLMKKCHKIKFEIEAKTQICKKRRNCLCNPQIFIFFDFRMIGRTDFTYCEISPKQIEENQNQSQITTCERFPLWSFSSRTKIIILILTTGNDSPILVYYVLVTFSHLEERKHQKVSIKT